MKKLLLIIGLALVLTGHSQTHGKVVVYTNLNQSFLVSLNGIRLSNQYATKSTFEFAEENDYRVKVWFQGAQYPLNFNLQSTPGYESVYQIAKDQYGAYILNLISKVIMGANPPSSVPTATPTPVPAQTVSATANIPVIKEMTSADFNERLNTVKNESFDDSKLEKAKFVFKDEYFTSNQAATAVQVFSFETKKVEFAKFAYKRTVDKKNYYKVVDALTFDSYKRELQDWIKKNP